MPNQGRNVKRKPKVVVIEDDQVFANLLELSLSNNGYDVASIASVKEAIEFIPASKGVDLFIVDYNLGDEKGNGLDLCRKIKAYAHKPVVMLTGESSTETTVACLYAGADQYVLKPYDLKDLLARIHSALYNQPKPSMDMSNHKLSVNDVVLDGMSRTLTCGTTSVRLTERELAVAEVLFSNHNTEIKRDFIYSSVYGHQMKAFSRAADILIARFRKKLRQISDDLLILPTRSAGYILVSKSNAQAEK
jgi:two-component system response regulator MprA